MAVADEERLRSISEYVTMWLRLEQAHGHAIHLSFTDREIEGQSWNGTYASE